MNTTTEISTTNGKAKKHTGTPREIDVSRSQLVRSTQPRKIFKGIEELSVDIKRRGILDRLIVRELPNGKFEIVDGERRDRACELAGITTVPVSVRDLTDAEVLEIQLVSQGQREPLHPLEEADAFKQLHDVHGYTHEVIAGKVAKSVSTVVARMKLCSLGKEARKAFYEDKITIATALLIASLPLDVQVEATDKVTRTDYRGDLPSAGDVADIIERSFALSLKDAPFDTKDAQLVPAAGACTTCPKRSLAQTEMFGNDQKDDFCLDRKCHGVKVAEHWKLTKEQAKKKHLPVLEGKKASAALAHGSDYVKLDEKDYNDPKTPSFRAKVKKVGAEVPVTIAKDQFGAPVELVRREDLKKAGIVKGTKPTTSFSAEEKKRREREKAKKDKEHDEVVQLLSKVGKVGNAKHELAFARILVQGIIAQVWSDAVKRICADHDVAPVKKQYGTDHRAALQKHCGTLDIGQLRELAVELVASSEPTRKAFIALYGG